MASGSFNRQLTILLEGDKMQKIATLKQLKASFSANSVLQKGELRELLHCLVTLISGADPAEKVREMALDVATAALEKDAVKPHELLIAIVPHLVKRLSHQQNGIGDTDHVVESSEEIRSKCVTLLLSALSKALMIEGEAREISSLLPELVTVLCGAIGDRSPDVKKVGCEAASVAARLLHRQNFHQQSESLTPVLLAALTHQHSKVRIQVVRCIADVVQLGSNKPVEDIAPHLVQRLFDQAPAVRKATVQLAGDWLLELPDRYSFFHRLIPILLTGLSDDVTEIAEIADNYWKEAGEKYAKENEADVKDKLDFALASNEGVLLAKRNFWIDTGGISRPNIGCRLLVQRQLHKLLPALARDLSDWIVETRLKSSQLLFWLLVNAEEAATQHVSTILISALVTGLNDDDRQVRRWTLRAAEVMAFFVPADVLVQAVLDRITVSRGSPPSLAIAGAICRMVDFSTNIDMSTKQLVELFGCLCSPEISHTVEASCQCELIGCVSALLISRRQHNEDGSSNLIIKRHLGYHLFSMLVTATALSPPSALDHEVLSTCFDYLGQIICDDEDQHQKLSNKERVFCEYSNRLLDSLLGAGVVWSRHDSTHRKIFETLIRDCGPQVFASSTQETFLDRVVDAIIANGSPRDAPEHQLALLSLLGRLLSSGVVLDAKNSSKLVSDFVLPNCTWKPGRAAEAIRLCAVSVLVVFVESGLLAQASTSLPLIGIEILVKQLTGLLSDDLVDTRLTSCRVFDSLLRGFPLCFGADLLHSLYPEFLKRLDDISDSVRLAVIGVLTAYVDAHAKPYDETGVYRAHSETLFNSLLVHLDDDSSPKFQEAVFQLLKCATRLDPALLSECIGRVRFKFRSVAYLDKLTQGLSQPVQAAESNGS